uniref:Uncharacterized protein n=1 Tax=Nelumbo nucifera TaxID=4432 RepID=A0A822X9T8_NELNU|nr:TPA_asm: hypothetical protein HUJ06_019687 [Nelumbo nucifera]
MEDQISIKWDHHYHTKDRKPTQRKSQPINQSLNQVSSAVASAKEQQLSSLHDQTTVCCCFVVQSSKIAKLLVDFPVIKSQDSHDPSQSVTQCKKMA